MSEQTKPSAGALRATTIMARENVLSADEIYEAAEIIDRETGLVELLDIVRMAESSLSSLEACNLWIERDHQRLNQLRQAIAKAEAK